MDQYVPQPPDAGAATAPIDAAQSGDIRAADLRSLWLAILIIGGSIIVSAAARITDIRLHRTPDDPAEIWLLEVISHLAILLLIPAVFLVLDRAPLAAAAWRRALPVHILGALGFAAAHIALMALARELAFPPILDKPYDGDLFAPARLAAETAKDGLLYLLLVLGLSANRAVERHRGEARAALARVRASGAVTLRSGGHTYIVNAADIVCAKAAENYVEVASAAKSYLARMTLTQLERLLAEAGPRHLRVHRSYIVNLAHVAAVAPTGEGDLLLTLSTGTVVPCSRRFREKLESGLEARA